MKLKAVIFDLNGTVLEDEDFYEQSFKKILRKLGAKVGSNFSHTPGIGVLENWPILLARYKVKTTKTMDQLAFLTQEEYLRNLENIELKNGFEVFLNKIKAAGALIALATSNNWTIVERIFETLEIEKHFDVVTTSEEVSLNKPSPDIFLITADKLNIEPELCLVIEDSVAGIEGAQAASMKTIAIARNDKQREKLSYADLVVTDFTDITPERLLKI